MATAIANPPGELLESPGSLPRSLYRLSVDKYESLVRAGVFTKRDRLELIEGLLVAKTTQYPAHSVCAELCRVALGRILPPGWHLRVERPLRIPSRASVPEPDLVIARGEIRDFAANHPEPADVALVVEVADSSLDDDRKLMSRVYGGGGVPVYWVVNLPDRQVEVYSDPSGSSAPAGYGKVAIFRPGGEIAVGIAGIEIGRIPVADLLP